jgi:branched-chain amino acid transport system ATP-binding protein
MTATPLLEVLRLEAYYGPTKALHGIDFGLETGAIATILGANGAGKTTALRALSGLVRRRGEIRFEGDRIDACSTEDIARRGVAHVPDGRGTFVDLTVEENLRVGAYARRDRRGVAADLDTVYGYFPRLAERRRQPAGTLSGGEQQMLAISRALMLRPKLLLLDEPSFGLAPRVVREIFDIMRAVNREQNIGILLVEQNASLALALADHAYLLETGRLVMAGAAETMACDEAIRRSYLGY